MNHRLKLTHLDLKKIAISDAETPQPDRDLNGETLLVKL